MNKQEFVQRQEKQKNFVRDMVIVAIGGCIAICGIFMGDPIYMITTPIGIFMMVFPPIQKVFDRT